VLIRVWTEALDLWFEVSDDGAGFEPDPARPTGHGFVNMHDRLGAVGGRLEVKAAIGRGTTVRGRIPIG
jgi:signal transduction histidine kinase